jgi:DNA uptake protein ComE-like DNA-binding protein
MRSYGLMLAAALALSLMTPAGAQAPSALQQFAQAPLDINSASKQQLDALPGIGTARADAIIKGRPYKGKDDLVQKGIIPQSVYDGIKDKIIARQR